MGMMNKLRENTGVILWILVFAFGVIWVLQDSGGLGVIGANPAGNVIVVNGDPITYDEYSRALDAQLEAFQQQSGEAASPQQVEQEEERLFDMLVEAKLMEHEMERLGIEVTDQEIYDMVLGETPHPIIQVYFGDGKGGVDRALLQNFVDDPEATDQWIQLEEYLRTERRRQKLNNLITASVRISPAEVDEEHRRRTTSVDAQYVLLRYAEIADDSVQLADADYDAFYDAHREDFKRERSYTLKYASITKLPSAEDSAAVMEDLQRLRNTFATAEDDSLFLVRYASERPLNRAFLGPDDLGDEVAEAVLANPQPGTIVGPLLAGDEAHLVKILEVRPAEEPSVRASHILVPAGENDAQGRVAAQQKAADLKAQLDAGADFAALARQHSSDGSASRGGDLGWFGRGQMVGPFEEAAFGTPVGGLAGPVETQFGYHVIKVTGKAEQEVRVADYVQSVDPSSGTLTDAQERLEDLQYYATEEGDFEQVAERLNLELQEVQVEQEQRSIPGLGPSRSLMTFLEDADVGDVSDVIELNDVFIVASVKEIQPEGYRPLDEVKDQIKPQLLLEKKRALQRARMERAYQGGDDLAAVAKRLKTAMRQARGVTYGRSAVSGLGRDLGFSGALLGLKQGQVTGIIEGENGVFIAKVERITQATDALTEQQRSQIGQQLLRERRAQVRNAWIETLKENADIEDLRRQFRQQM